MSSLLDQVLAHPDVVKGAKGGKDWAIAWCPWHPDRGGKTPNLGINVESGAVRCFRCGEWGLKKLARAWGILAEQPQAPAKAASRGDGVNENSGRGRSAPEPTMTRQQADDLLMEAYRLRPDTLKLFDIRSMPAISSPGRTKTGAWRYPTGAGTRYKAFDRKAPHKVWWARGTDPEKRRTVLYGADKLEAGIGTVYLVNGEPSVWVCRQAGLPAVAAFGEGNLTDGQARALAQLDVTEVRVVLDLDGAGARNTARDIEILQGAGLTAVPLALPDHLGERADIADLYVWLTGDDEKFRAAVAELQIRPIPTADPLRDTPYSVRRGRFHVTQKTREGDVDIPVTNFTARAVEEVMVDDGTEPVLHLRFVGRLDTGEPLPEVRVPATKALSLNWIPELWGLRPVIRAGASHRDSVREIIQRVSLKENLPRQTVYCHTGWKKISGQWRFLAPGDQAAPGVTVELDDTYARYRLPAQTPDTVEAVKASLRFLYTADRSVTIPLLAFTYLAPLQSILRPAVALWLQARTGSYKSTLSALAMSHFGSFEYNTPPMTWEATSRGIERYLHDLKDCLAWVDDFRPRHTESAERIQEQKATEVLASIGNVQSRGRMRADTRLQKTFTPQALLLSTAELPPRGDSIIARTFPVRFTRDQVDLTELGLAQQDAVDFPHAMRGYLDWIATRYDELRSRLPGRVVELRDEVPAGDSHARARGAIANLQVGIELLCEFAQESGAKDDAFCRQLRDEAWAVFLRLSEGLSERLREEDPVVRFNAAMDTLLSQQRAVFMARGSDDPVPWGKDLLGWYDDEYLYFDFLASYNAVAQFNRQSGAAIGMGEPELRQAFAERGLIEQREGDHLTSRISVNGRRHRVLIVPRQRVAYGEHIWGEVVPEPHQRSLPTQSDGDGVRSLRDSNRAVKS